MNIILGNGQILFDIINPIGCIDCHNPETMELQVNRKYLNEALKAEGKTS